jgi:hypothetical protein
MTEALLVGSCLVVGVALTAGTGVCVADSRTGVLVGSMVGMTGAEAWVFAMAVWMSPIDGVAGAREQAISPKLNNSTKKAACFMCPLLLRIMRLFNL